MSRWVAYLNTSKRIVENYGGIPLSAWLKDFFRQHKQMGSNDRKNISQAVYCFYRLGHSIDQLSLEERMLAGLFLCNQSPSQLLAHFKPTWNNNISESLTGKAAFLLQDGISWKAGGVFCWLEELSTKIDKELFSLSHLSQPDLFLRIRPRKEEVVIRKLEEAGIVFNTPGRNCIALANATRVDQTLKIDQEVVVQDYSSQRVGDYFNLPKTNTRDQSISLWDCCAGSGGKSILAYDHCQDINLTVTDSRPSILQNLRQRFEVAGIHHYQSYVTDLSLAGSLLPPGKFEYIIADVPCSGSGTWARTPEQLYFFNRDKISYYSGLQKKIVSRIVHQMTKTGKLVYITCSVFKEENEDLVQFILDNFDLRLEAMELLAGYEMKADSMFVAVLSNL